MGPALEVHGHDRSDAEDLGGLGGPVAGERQIGAIEAVGDLDGTGEEHGHVDPGPVGDCAHDVQRRARRRLGSLPDHRRGDPPRRTVVHPRSQQALLLRRLIGEPASSLARFADSLAGTFPACDDAPLARALRRELAKGQPIAPPFDTELAAAVARWPNIERDEHGRIVAFSGLSLTPAAHRFTIAGRQLYTWCAWDTLFLPALLDQPAQVESTCPITASPLRLTVDQSGVRDVHPEAVWVSFPAPGTTSTADITGTFCSHVHFLAGQRGADQWLSRHPGATALTLSDAFELGRLATRCYS
jgi:alkylmercury lyase